MKSSSIFASLVFILSLAALHAQGSEIFFKFTIDSREELKELTKLVSIDNVKDNVVYAYADEEKLEALRKLGYDYITLPHPGTLIKPKMSTTKAGLLEWDSYPTYEAYVDMMNQFALDYPSLCVIVDIGNSVEGRDILFAKISDNVDTEEDEPEVMYTATMHGDETTGYILMLRLIDSLLTGYGNDSLITRLVDSCEIWINPLANPDGTYRSGNHTVYGASRNNANHVDLNRNFPDPEDGDHPDGHDWQPEAIAMMDLGEAHSFVISANHHGGAEVINYPWDTWVKRHADDQWFIDISRNYADSAQYYSPSGYLNDLNNGITNGYDWYTIAGGRQDYMNWWHGCREVTTELSQVKLLPADELPAHWNYNRVSLLDYLENALYGIRGIVTDVSTGLPIAAKVTVIDHDFDHSEVYTDPDVGDYHRMIEAGTYNLEFSAPDYYTHIESTVMVTDWNTTIVDVALQPLHDVPILEFDGHTAGEAGPGDTVAMKITLVNIGGSDATSVNGLLYTEDSNITITESTSSFPDIAAQGGEGTSLSDYEFVISPDCPNFYNVEFLLEVSADGDFSDTLTFSFFVGESVVIFFDNFSLDQGWSGLGGSGEWIIGPAAGGSGSDSYGGPDPDEDHSPGEDNQVLGNDLDPGNGGDYNGLLSITYWVISPITDCSGFSDVQMTFYRWLGVEDSTYDRAYLEVYDGDSWIALFENDSGNIDESSWNEISYDLSAYADSNADFQIRFGIGPTDASINYCGWNIDDLELKGYGEPSPKYPDMAYSPASIVDSLQLGETSVDTIRVYNNGDTSLTVKFSSTDDWLGFDTSQHSVAVEDSLLLPVTIITEGLMPGDYDGSIDFICNDPDTPSGSIPVALNVEASFICGDVNADDGVNLLDITYLIDYLYKGGEAPDPPESGDVNNSGGINMLDITYLISYLYKGGPEPDCP